MRTNRTPIAAEKFLVTGARNQSACADRGKPRGPKQVAENYAERPDWKSQGGRLLQALRLLWYTPELSEGLAALPEAFLLDPAGFQFQDQKPDRPNPRQVVLVFVLPRGVGAGRGASALPACMRALLAGRLVEMDGGREVELDSVKNPHLDHGYAVTSHSSQGQTADRVLIHVDTKLGAKDLLNNRMAYVAVSRGAYDAQIFTNDREKLGAALGHDVSHSSAHAPEMKPEQKQEQAVTPQQEIAPKQEQGEDFGLGL